MTDPDVHIVQHATVRLLADLAEAGWRLRKMEQA